MLFIPVGFAHGFQALSEEAVVGYKLTAAYAPDFERGIRWDDPSLSIPWPIEEPILSGKDQRWPRLKDAEAHFTYQEEGA
jgi:dTDP-4-dehydrorhamnose 3,5-epimerase